MGSIMDQERPWERPDYLEREQKAARESREEKDKFLRDLMGRMSDKWKIKKVNK